MNTLKKAGSHIDKTVAGTMVLMIQGYQLLIRPVLPQTCRFYPSCSVYAIESLRRHGSIKGLVLTLYRLLRCNPFNGGGHDPVPIHFTIFR